MRVGVTLPSSGPSANAHAVIRGAQHAERLGYDSLWVLDRLLYPVTPRHPG
jgi:alkanesulfonate monooxygenase SsuD/methylene tetrahydromethanopterin reductase-like flavin-dependent oxidoreductase (luciferase family)